jgi:hypothetical protein
MGEDSEYVSRRELIARIRVARDGCRPIALAPQLFERERVKVTRTEVDDVGASLGD